MAFDSFVLHAVKTDLEKHLVQTPCKVQRVIQPNAVTLLLEFRGQRPGAEALFFSIHPVSSRVHLTSRHYPRPSTPPAFCMLLRKHLSGGKLVSVEQPPLERMLYLHFLATNEQGRETPKTLVAEIMGRHSNLILIDPLANERPKILGCLKPVPAALNRYRAILPNHPYDPPPLQDKLHPFALNYEYFRQEVLQQQGTRIEAFFLDHFQGFSPFLTREIASRANLDVLEESAAPLLWEKLQELMAIYTSAAWQPTLLHGLAGLPEDYFAFKPHQNFKETLRFFSSMSGLLDEFFEHKERHEAKTGLYRYLHQLVTQQLEKTRRKEKKQQKELAETERAEEYRRLGELLYLNIHAIHPKSHQFEAKDPYEESGGSVLIPLDPGISPSQNAQRYFKKYRKAKQGAKEISRQLKKTRQEIKYLDSVLFAMEKADLESLGEIREELEEAGYLPRQQAEPQGKKARIQKPLSFLSSQGETILVGRNNRQNDDLSLRLAAKTDYWLHAKNIPGAHVIIRSSSPHEATLVEAALLAAHFSRASRSSKVPIDYTRVKNLRRIPGPRPGMVTFSNYKTLYVTPDEKSMAPLLGRAVRQRLES